MFRCYSIQAKMKRIFHAGAILMSFCALAFAGDIPTEKVDPIELKKYLWPGWEVSTEQVDAPTGWTRTGGGSGVRIDLNHPQDKESYSFSLMPLDWEGNSAFAQFKQGVMTLRGPRLSGSREHRFERLISNFYYFGEDRHQSVFEDTGELEHLPTYLVSIGSAPLAPLEQAGLAHAVKDYPKAIEALTPLASSGDARAAATLAAICFEGKRYEEAERWFQAAKQSDKLSAYWWSSQHHLDKLSADAVTNSARLSEWQAFRKRAESGDPEAQWQVASMLKDGQHNLYLAADMPESLIWWRKSADQGTPIAQYYAGQILYEGAQGVPKDAQAGLAYLRAAAAQNYEQARSELDQINKWHGIEAVGDWRPDDEATPRSQAAREHPETYATLTRAIAVETTRGLYLQRLAVLHTLKDLAEHDATGAIWVSLEEAFESFDGSTGERIRVGGLEEVGLLSSVNASLDAARRQNKVSDEALLQLLAAEWQIGSGPKTEENPYDSAEHRLQYSLLRMLKDWGERLPVSAIPFMQTAFHDDMFWKAGEMSYMPEVLFGAVVNLGAQAEPLVPDIARVAKQYPRWLMAKAIDCLNAIGTPTAQATARSLSGRANTIIHVFTGLRYMLGLFWIAAAVRFAKPNLRFMVGVIFVTLYAWHAWSILPFKYWLLMNRVRALNPNFRDWFKPWELDRFKAGVELALGALVLSYLIAINSDILRKREQESYRSAQDAGVIGKLLLAVLMPALAAVGFAAAQFALVVSAGSHNTGGNWGGFALYPLAAVAMPLWYLLAIFNLRYLNGASSIFRRMALTNVGITALVFMVSPIWMRLGNVILNH